jgi:hypothetical protein
MEEFQENIRRIGKLYGEAHTNDTRYLCRCVPTSTSSTSTTSASASLSLDAANGSDGDANGEEYCSWRMSCTDIHSQYWEREFSYQDLVAQV